MRTLSPIFLLLCSSACAPWGTIHTPEGSDRLRAAFHYETTEGGYPVLLLLLANTPLSCGLPDASDAEERSEAALNLVYARTREGAHLVGFKLYGASGDDWPGTYDVDPAAGAALSEEPDQRTALAVYRAVIEAEVQELHGLYRAYEEVEVVQVFGVEAPGTVVLRSASERSFGGQFELASLDVSGTFETEGCGDASQVFQWLGLDMGAADTP